MRKWVLSLLLVLVTCSVYAAKEGKETEDTPKFPKGKGALLIGELGEGKVYGSLERMVGKKKAKEIRLIGHSSFDTPQDKLLAGNKFVLIGWLGVQKIKEPSKVVMFKEPIVSSFIVKNDTDVQGVVLPTFGEAQYLTDAIKDLEANKIDEEDLKKKRVIKIPTGKATEIVLPTKNRTHKGKVQTENMQTLQDTEKTSSADIKLEPSEEMNVSEWNNSKESKNRSNTQNQTRSLSPNLSTPGSQNGMLGFEGLQGRHLASSSQHAGQIPSSSAAQVAHAQNIPARATFANVQDFELHLLSEINENQLPVINGNAVVLVQKPNGKREAYFVKNGAFIRNGQGHLIHKEVGVNVEGLPNGRVERNGENRARVNQIIENVLFDYRHSEEGRRNPLDLGAEITVQVTEEGCLPEHDVLQERVTILSRANKFENGHLIEEGNCEKTLETYPVKKDYLCESCQDEVDLQGKKAYARYREYWVDREGHRHDLGIKIDRDNPFAFFEEREGCGFDIETEPGFAVKMSKLVYLNKFRVPQIVENCRVIPNSQKFPVQEITRGCELIHDFQNKVSHEQKRAIFMVEGVEHEAKACHLVDPALEHEFVEMGCRPIVDLVNNLATSTARRRIRTSAGLKTITEECEPVGNNPLQATREGCEGEYFHDFNAMKSYLKKRYYIPRPNNQREYVTSCMRVDEFLPQQTESNGTYEHDDIAKVSKPRLSLYIDTDQGRLVLEPHKVRGQLGQVNYTFVHHEHRPTNQYYFEGCYRRTRSQSINIYQRADASFYEENLGEGNIIASQVDECKRGIDKTLIGQTGIGHKIKIYHTRTMVTYPDGSVEYGPWNVNHPLQIEEK